MRYQRVPSPEPGRWHADVFTDSAGRRACAFYIWDCHTSCLDRVSAGSIRHQAVEQDRSWHGRFLSAHSGVTQSRFITELPRHAAGSLPQCAASVLCPFLALHGPILHYFIGKMTFGRRGGACLDDSLAEGETGAKMGTGLRPRQWKSNGPRHNPEWPVDQFMAAQLCNTTPPGLSWASFPLITSRFI